MRRGRKPAAKVEFGERRIWFWSGNHGLSEKEKEVMVFSRCVWADDGRGIERRRMVKNGREKEKVGWFYFEILERKKVGRKEWG